MPSLRRDERHVFHIRVAAGLIERRCAVPLICAEEAVDLGEVDPFEQVWIGRMVRPPIGCDARDPRVHGSDPSYG